MAAFIGSRSRAVTGPSGWHRKRLSAAPSRARERAERPVAALNTIQRSGSRFYVDPDTGAKTPGVTSALSMLPKGFLQFWATKTVAESAVDNIGSLMGLAMNDRAGAIDYLKGAPRQVTKQAADIGSDAHDVFERLARGEDVTRVHPDLRALCRPLPGVPGDGPIGVPVSGRCRVERSAQLRRVV